MEKIAIYHEPILPWVDGKEDKTFRRMVVAFVITFLILGLVLNSLSVPEPEQKKLEDVSPRLAQLILEKKKEPPPPPPKPKEPEKPKEPKKEPPKTEEAPKPKPKPVAKPKEKTREAIREKVMQTGLLAEADALADLRDTFDLDQVTEQPQIKSEQTQATKVDTSKVLTAKATRGSDGIKTDTLSRKIETSELAQRQTTKVESKIASKQQVAKAATPKSRTANRSEEEIERIFQKNKGGIFNIYNRALRKDPSLQGKVVFELTIAPNGSVTKVTVLSSELGDKKLEKRLASKIKKFKFAQMEVPAITVQYPIDFLPS